MRRKYVRNLIFFGAVLLLIGVSVGVLGSNSSQSAQADSGPPVSLEQRLNPLLNKAQLVQQTPGSQPLAISVGLQMRNQAEFTNVVHSIYDMHSPLYHQYLTPAQFAQEFAPTSDQVQQVVTYLQKQGMSVTNIAPNNLLLDVSANVSQAQHAFSVQINNYKIGKSTFYANASPLKVPARIGSLVTAVVGTDSSIKFHTSSPHAKMTPASGPVGYQPKDIASAYDLALLQSAGFLGENQTIALFELDGYQSSDVAQYIQYFNLASSSNGTLPNVSDILVDNYSGAAGQGAAEVTLDMEMVAAVAPHANMLVYEGPNTLQGLNDTYARIVNDNKAQTVSISWGLCETFSGNTELQLLDNIFKQGSVQGISFFAAAGDAGAYDCGDTNLAVDSPADDPYVTGVGGTSLLLNPDGSYNSESVWADPTDTFHGPKGSGGGGGVSTVYKQPGWQVGSGVQNSYSTGYREVPDVSANASPNPGYAVYCTASNAACPSTGWVSIAGTSAAAPIWAASTALINQYMQVQAKKQLGLINPALYGLFNGYQAFPAFHDVTTGTNNYYPATSGYDMASGLGSPDVFNIARDLVINVTGILPGLTPTPSPTAAPMPTPTPTPTSTPTTVLAQDNFQRANQTYWGTASDGHTWTSDADTNTIFSINNNAGQVANGSGSYSAILGSSGTDEEGLFTGSISNYSSTNIGAVLRWNDGNNWYKAYLDGASLIVQKKVNGTAAVLSAAAFPATAGASYNLRFRVVGSTLYAKAWAGSSAEPAGWMVTTNDSTFQHGYCGLRMQVYSNSATFTSFQAVIPQ